MAAVTTSVAAVWILAGRWDWGSNRHSGKHFCSATVNRLKSHIVGEGPVHRFRNRGGWPRKDLLLDLAGGCFRAAVGDARKNALQISQGSQKCHYVSLLLLGQLPIEHEIKIFYRVLQRE